MRDHGGNIDGAMAAHGGAAAEWLDLSTGINPHAWPVPALPLRAWTALPTRADMAALEEAAQTAYATRAACVPLAGASAAIQMVPLLAPQAVARVLGPTYNEHAAALRHAGWRVEEVSDPAALAGADLAVVVNPNNPDGRTHAPASLRALAGQVGLLVADESFVDVAPELSLAPGLEDGPPNLLVLRSFGKFYGLAGLRLGFALARAPLADRLREMAGPWPVSGAAVEIGRRALRDRAWQDGMRARLAAQAAQLDRDAAGAGWRLVGGTSLFRTWETPDAAAAQDALAAARIWSRIFPWSRTWLRLGLPPEDGRARLAAVLAGMG